MLIFRRFWSTKLQAMRECSDLRIETLCTLLDIGRTCTLNFFLLKIALNYDMTCFICVPHFMLVILVQTFKLCGVFMMVHDF